MESGLNRNNRNAVEVPSQTRKIRPTRRSVSGIFSFRGQHSIPYESTLERDFLARTEFNGSVAEIIPQPARIPFISRNGRTYNYTPDFLVYYRDGVRPLLVEVKPRDEIRAHWGDMKYKFREALRYARERGWNFRVLDESRIRDQVFQNILFLQRYKRMQFPAEVTRCILSDLNGSGQASFQTLMNRHFRGEPDAAMGASHLRYLLVKGQLACDMTLPLGNDTVLWVPNHG